MHIELAKMLKLVAPISMSAEAQAVWIAAAADALEDIRVDEVRAISAELRRTVTRAAQIVPEIARMVADKRKRPAFTGEDHTPQSKAFAIDREAQRRRNIARGRDEVEAAWQWERDARIGAGLHVPPFQKPLTTTELEDIPPHIVNLGLAYGFLTNRDGRLVEA